MIELKLTEKDADTLFEFLQDKLDCGDVSDERRTIDAVMETLASGGGTVVVEPDEPEDEEE